EADKMNPRLHYLRGLILQEQVELVEAAAALRRAIYLDERFIMAHIAAAHLARRLGRDKDADRSFAAARRLLADHGADAVPEAEGLDARQLTELLAADSR